MHYLSNACRVIIIGQPVEKSCMYKLSYIEIRGDIIKFLTNSKLLVIKGERST